MDMTETQEDNVFDVSALFSGITLYHNILVWHIHSTYGKATTLY